MPARWFYGRDESRMGPYSAVEMKALASAGSVHPEDTVWQEGVARGVPARKVKNLFAPVPEGPPIPGLAMTPTTLSPKPTAAPGGEPARAEEVPPLAPARSEKPQPRTEPPARKGRATAGRGAIIVGQDGVTVKFRKKCSTCGHQGSSWQTLPIRAGVMKSTYFCPKCKKTRDVEVVGNLH